MAIVEVLALAGAVTKISSSISSAVKAGKDVHSILPAFGRLADLEAQINLAESGKHKGFLGRLTSSEAEGYEIASAKMAHKKAQDELKSTCRLFGPPGMWDLVVKEQAAARVRKRKALEDEADRRDKLFMRLGIGAGVIIFICGAALMFWGAAWLADEVV
mgnify:FL=1|jgi:hypothetical protein